MNLQYTVKKVPKKKVVHKANAFFANFGLAKERDYLIENLAMLVSSGMTLFDAISSISEGVRSQRMKTLLINVRTGLDAGIPLWAALKDSQLFPDHAISLLRLGEESGNLVDNLRVLGIQQEKERTFKSKVRSAVMYPVFVLGLTFSIGVAIAWFVLPQLAKVFDSLKLELPLVTKILIGTGVFLSEYGHIAVPLLVLFLGSLLYVIFSYKKTRFIGQYIIFSTPIFSRLVQEVEISRFGYLLGTLLEARLSVVDALESLAASADSPPYTKLYRHLRRSIDEGHSFRESFRSYKRSERLIPLPMQQLIAAGEKSGALAKTLQKIGQAYEVKAELTTKNLTVILEPVLLVIVWVGVVGVAMAVILPIYSLIGGLNK